MLSACRVDDRTIVDIGSGGHDVCGGSLSLVSDSPSQTLPMPLRADAAPPSPTSNIYFILHYPR